MSDELIFDYIVGELEKSCPGMNGCHGCQSWCPKCGTVDHVCDDKECDTHRRDTDALRDLEDLEGRFVRIAKNCRFIEKALLETEGRRADDVRTILRRGARNYADGEQERQELENELAELRGSYTRLVPRAPGTKRVPRDR